MGKKYYSEASAAVHESARGLFHVGAIDEDRMREFDEMCLVEEPKKTDKTANPVKTQRQSHWPA